MFLYFVVFIFGAIIGSFLNVVIVRHNTGESSLAGSSRCFNCGKKLGWRELIPIISFAIQKGRCRQCGSKISIQYPLVELFTGLIFLLIFLKTFTTDYRLLTTGYYFIIFSILIAIAVYDMRHQIIPNAFVYTFGILAFLNLFGNLKFEIRNFDTTGFLAGIAFFAFFAVIWLVSKGKAMGFGDAKLALGIGWLFGLQNGIAALLFSFWIGAAASISLLILSKKRYTIKSKIAFGPFLVAGAIIAFLFAGDIIKII